MDIALDHLTEAEQDAIYAVLHRDDELRTKEHERIRQLQNDVKKIKLAGVIKPGIDADKTCARCRKEFGWIFNKGQICPNCQHKVCENCKANLKIGGWICILCQKQREIEAMSGQWFYKKFRKSKRNRKTNQIISGNEIIRASIRKKPSPPRYGRMRNPAEFEARNAGRRVGSPSSLFLGSDGGGEDSDTQSTEMGPTSRHRRQDVAFPKTSDQARLQNLITGGGTVAANPPPTRRVISVSGMGHDSSSSESEPSSPVLPKSNKHVFTHDDSILSSDRASPVSAISSEGHMTMVTERDISDIESLRSAVSGMEDFDSKRDSARAETAAAPPRRIAKTLEQERLEALEEKSQEDLTGYSDSDGLLLPSRVKHSPDVGGALPLVANNPYDRLRATNPLLSTDYHLTMASLTSLHVASASTSHKKSPNTLKTTEFPHRTLTDATTHASMTKNTPIPELHIQHPQGLAKSSPANQQQSTQSSNSSAKCLAFMKAPHVDVMYEHYSLNLNESSSSSSNESDVESQDGYSLNSRDADVESLDSHRESLDSHTPRESLEYATPNGSLEYHTPRESMDIPSDSHLMDAEMQRNSPVFKIKNNDSSLQPQSTGPSSDKRPLQLDLEQARKVLRESMSSSSSSSESSDELTPSSPCWHPAWAAAVAGVPQKQIPQPYSDRTDITRIKHLDPTTLDTIDGKSKRSAEMPTKVFNPFDVIVHDDVKYSPDQLHKISTGPVSMTWDEDPGWDELRVKDSFSSPKSPRSEYREASLLDAEDNDDDYLEDDDMDTSFGADTIPYLPNYWQSVAHKDEDDRVSDTLSVITELTEPVDSDKSWSDDDFSKSLDNTVMELEFKMLSAHSPREKGLTNTNKAWLRSYRSMSLTSTLAYNECIAVSGDSDVASLTDLVTANQDDNDLEFTAVYELNSSLNGPANYTKEPASKVTASKEIASKETASTETASEETASKETASKETAVKETASKETAVKETAPKETAGETLLARTPQIESSTIQTQQMVPSETPPIESSTIQTQQMVPSETDNKLDESPSSVMAAVKTWESRKTPDRSYLGNEIDWSQVEEIDMVEEDDESDLTASDGGFSASALLDVPGAEERTMKRAGGVVISNDSGAKIFRSSESSTGSELVTDKSNIAPDDHEMQDTHVYVNGMITPTNSASSSDSTQTPSRSETAAAQHEALKELRANISVALQRLSNSPHDEEFQFEKSSHSSHEEEEEHDYRKLNVSPQNEENLSGVVHRENVMRSMNRNTIDELADGYENFQVPAPSSVKLREQMLRNANRNTLDFLAEENEMEHEKEIDLDDIIEENTHDVVVATENIPSKVDTWNNFATVQAKTSHFDSDSETDKESDEDQNMTVVEAKEIALALPITFNSFDWERLDQQGLKTDVAEEDPESEEEIHPDASSVTEITEEITYEETTVMKRQPSDPSDTMRGSRHRKMYVIDTDHKIVVPGLNSDDESDSLNEQSSSNRSSTINSGENEPPVIVKDEDCDINITNDTDTAIANVDDTANMPPAINSAIKQKAPQPNFLQLVQSRLGFGPDYDTTKKSVSFNPYTEEYSDHSTEKSPDTSFVTEKVSEVATIHVMSNKLEENPVASSGSEESDSGDQIDQPVVVVVSNLETNAMPEAKEITRDSRSGSSNSEQSLENYKMDDPSDQEGQFELRAKSDSQISTKSSSDSSREEISLELHETADTVSETDSERDIDSPLKVEDLNSQKRVLVRQDMYVESDSDIHDLSKSDSRESKEEEPSTDAMTSESFDDVYESVSLGSVDVVPGLAVVNKNINEEQRSRNGSELKDGEDSDDGLADSMAASMVAQTLRDVGWDESSDGLVRDAVCDSPVASVGDDISANSDRARSDSSLNEGDLSMNSSELINPAPPTTSPSSSMAPEDTVGNDSANEANSGVVPSIIVSEVNKDGSVGRRSKTSAMSEESSLVEPRFDDEEEEDIDELFSSAAVNRSTTNLSSTYSESRESIASYYSDAGEGSKYPVTGDIEFGAHYNYTTGILEVNVKKCRNIAAVDAKKKRSDPYVKAYLLPDKNRAGKRKTKIKKHTINPVFDEILRFSITKSELESRTLSLSVWHNDKFGRNDFLGEVVVPIDGVNIDDLKPDWYPLLDRLLPLTPTSVVTYKGDLLISLQYAQTDPSKPGSLHVRVKEARNLTPKDNGASDPFCKGYLLPDKTSKQSKQKTAVKKKTVNPKWDQTLIFSGVSLSDLTQRSLELTVWDHDRFNRNDFLGGVRLNLATGQSEGQEVDWMDARGEEVSLWQSMIHRPNVWIDGNLMLRPSMDQRN